MIDETLKPWLIEVSHRERVCLCLFLLHVFAHKNRGLSE